MYYHCIKIYVYVCMYHHTQDLKNMYVVSDDGFLQYLQYAQDIFVILVNCMYMYVCMYVCDLNFISDVSYGENQKNRLDPSEYYVRLGRAMVGIALPGVGYDTFRYVGYQLLVISNMMYVCMHVFTVCMHVCMYVCML